MLKYREQIIYIEGRKMKRKKIALLTFENFTQEIQNILIDSEVEYLVFLYFTSNMKNNISLLDKSKKYFVFLG